MGAVVIPCPVSGWVSQVSLGELLRAAPPATTVRIETRGGAYIHAGEPLLTAWPPPAEHSQQQLASAIAVSGARTMQQDVDFAIRQLVDIGLRALSAAVNDPTTAVEVTLRLRSLLRPVLTTPLAPPALGDSQDRLLVRPWHLDHDEYVAHAFDQLRQAAPSQPHVAAALLRVLRMLIMHLEASGCPERVPALRRQMQLLLDAVRTTPNLHPADVERLNALRSNETDPADHSRQP